MQARRGDFLWLGGIDRADIRAGYTRVEVAEDAGGVNVASFGPKFSLTPDRVALYTPVGFAFGANRSGKNVRERGAARPCGPRRG